MKTKSPHRQFLIGIFVFILTIAIGFVGYRMAGWSSLDSLYMVIITIFSVGYGEVHTDMSPALRLFTIGFIIAGCTSLLYTVGAFINWLTEGQLQQILGKRKMENSINQLTNHIVICGYGRVGKLLASRLHKAEKPFIIIDPDPALIKPIQDAGYLCIEGDATDETILEKARIKQASVLATVIPNDAANVFIVLSCRALNPNLTIIARADQLSTEAKLIQAGTDKVVTPAAIGADRIAQIVLRPNAQEILEQELHDNAFIKGLHDIGLEIDEIAVTEASGIAGLSLQKIETKEKGTFIIVAIRKPDGKIILKPSPDLTLSEGDTLIVMSHIGTIPDFIKQHITKRHLQYRSASL